MNPFRILILTFLFSNIKVVAQNNITNLEYEHHVGSYLSVHLDSLTFYRINFNDAYYLKEPEQMGKGLFFLRIPFKDKPIQTDFIAVETDSLGKAIKGKGSIVHISKTKQNNPYYDTLVIYNLEKTKKWVNFFSIKKPDSVSSATNRKTLDAVMIFGQEYKDEKFIFYTYLNVFAVLNPEQMEFMKAEGVFGVKPIDSDQYQTRSSYFDIGLDNRNYMNPVTQFINFEHPENLPAMDIKKVFQ